MIGVLVAVIAGAVFVLILMSITNIKKKVKSQNKLTNKIRTKGEAVVIKEFTKKLAKDPSNLTALTTLSDLFYEEKNYEKALPLYNRLCDLIQANPQIDKLKSYSRYGICCFKMGKTDDAGRSLVQALKIDPKDFNSNLYIGMALYIKKDYERALVCLRRAYVVNQTDPELTEYLGKVLYNLKRFRDSSSFLKRTLDSNPTNKEFMFLYASCMEEMNYYDKALKTLTLLRSDPVYGAESCIACAKIHEKTGEKEKVIQDYELALKNETFQKEKKLQIAYKLSNIYIQKHDIQNGLNLLRKIQMVAGNYKDVDMLVKRYQELNQNENLQTYLLSSVNDFTILCRNFVLNFYNDAKVKIEDVKVTSEGPEILAQVFSDKWEDMEMFKFFRSTGAVGELFIRDFHSKMRDIKCEKGFCVTAGSYTDEAKKYAEGRPIDLLDKQKLIIALKKLKN